MKIAITSERAGVHIIGAGPKNGEVSLHPGHNSIEKSDWDEIKTLPVIKHHLKTGDLKEGKVGDDTLDDLTRMKVPAAVELVGATLNVATLQKWLEKEKRPPVRAALTEQIATITQTENSSGAE